MLYQHITELIGNTPLLRLDPARHGILGVELYAKLEYCNPFGSVKDLIAWGMIREDLGQIAGRGQVLIEASSGNTAKALQVLAALYGLRLRALTNRAKVGEVRDILELLGVEVEEHLADGGLLRVATLDIRDAHGNPLEGRGVTPDLIVARTPADIARGRDGE